MKPLKMTNLLLFNPLLFSFASSCKIINFSHLPIFVQSIIPSVKDRYTSLLQMCFFNFPLRHLHKYHVQITNCVSHLLVPSSFCLLPSYFFSNFPNQDCGLYVRQTKNLLFHLWGHWFKHKTGLNI